MLGLASVVLRAAGCSYPKSETQLIGRWSFDETSGATFADAGGAVDGTIVGAWDNLSTDSLVTGDAGTSAFKTGVAHAVLPANRPAHDLASLTLSIYYEPRTAISKHVIINRGIGEAPGDFSIERLADRRLRGWHVGQDGILRFFGSTDGIAGTSLDDGTAYRIDVTFGPDGASLYLDGVLQSTIASNINGWNNTAPLSIGVWNDGTLAALDGAVDLLRLWSGQLSQADLALLEAPQSVALSAPPPSGDLLGSWPLSETSGTTFLDATGGNNATLKVPSWAPDTAVRDRSGIASGQGDHSLEVSNHELTIPMIVSYKQAAVSLVVYAMPLGKLRGQQYWDPTGEQFGREFIAFCDDGSTPGSFAIERRLVQTGFNYTNQFAWQWRLDGYVRNANGTAVRFSGGKDGIPGASLPVDTAKRIVLTQGPAGAELWLDGTKVAGLASVTNGWQSLSTPIAIGAGSSQGHANERSPAWSLIDEIRVYQGQADVAALPAAATPGHRWKWPSDFDHVTDINVADYSSLQAAFDAADSAGRYVYQDVEGEFGNTDTVWYQHVGGTPVNFRPGIKGLLNLQIRKPNNENKKFGFCVQVASTSGITSTGKMNGHTDAYAASGGYKFIGIKIDGNARGQNWHPKSGQAGYANTGFDLEQSHGLLFDLRGQNELTAKVDACEFHDGTGDALTVYTNTKLTATSNRFYGYFRGSIVMNWVPSGPTVLRIGESFYQSPLGVRPNGCGMHDIEPFGGTGSMGHFEQSDFWSEGDFDDESQGTDADIRYYNDHVVNGFGLYIGPSSQDGQAPVRTWAAHYCTLAYNRPGGVSGGGNYPPSWIRGVPTGTNGEGLLFDGCVFILTGGQMWYHNDWLVNATNDTTRAYISWLSPLGGSTRVLTMRDCEWRVQRLPAGIPQSNVQAIDFASFGTSRVVELDGVTIDGAFANFPFEMGGMTVRYRNVLHERTGNTKPWSGEGAEVAF